MAKWHINLKSIFWQKQIRIHNTLLRVHFSLKILQRTSDFYIFMEACGTLDFRKGPETEIFHPRLVNLPSTFREMAAFNWLPNFRSNAPSSFIYYLYSVEHEVWTWPERKNLRKKFINTNVYITNVVRITKTSIAGYNPINPV